MQLRPVNVSWYPLILGDLAGFTPLHRLAFSSLVLAWLFSVSLSSLYFSCLQDSPVPESMCFEDVDRTCTKREIYTRSHNFAFVLVCALFSTSSECREHPLFYHGTYSLLTVLSTYSVSTYSQYILTVHPHSTSSLYILTICDSMWFFHWHFSVISHHSKFYISSKL